LPAVLHRLVARGAPLPRDDGFGLIELLIAMTVMAIGISAIVAGFSSGLVALNNASRNGTAGTLADKQMEAYRALAYSSIRLTSAPNPVLDPTYTGDAAYDATYAVPTDATCSSIAPTCMPVQTQASGLSAPDGRNYRLDTYAAWSCPVGTLGGTAAAPTCAGARPVKKVTVVVRDGATPAKTYVRETSTFDAAT
jgi:prepilin-type N-terminal cleavage/methylation domain-containing protein